MKALSLLVGISLTVLAPLSSAQEVDPGLWEFKSKMNIPGMGDMTVQMEQMQRQLDSLPPETRAMVQEQMAAMGMQMGSGGAIRMCISPEDAKAEALLSGQSDGDCTYSDVVSTASTVKGRIACTDPQAQGEFEARLNGKRAFTSKVKMTSAEGTISGETEGRWIAADCGALQRPQR